MMRYSFSMMGVAMIVCQFDLAFAQSKTDIQGFQLGMTVAEINSIAASPRHRDCEFVGPGWDSFGYMAPREAPILDRHWIEGLYRELSCGRDGVFHFFMTKEVEPSVAKLILYEFTTGETLEDMIRIVSESFESSPVRNLVIGHGARWMLNGANWILDGDQDPFLQIIFNPTSIEKNAFAYRLTLASGALLRADEEVVRDRQRAIAPPPKL